MFHHSGHSQQTFSNSITQPYTLFHHRLKTAKNTDIYNTTIWAALKLSLTGFIA